MADHSDNKAEVDVYLCDCGPILKESVDLDRLAQELGDNPRITEVHRHPTLCSPEGKAWLAKELAERPERRAVFAACSPREHEATFRAACRQAEVNPFLIAIANIREQVAWGLPDRERATDKARVLTEAAVARCLQQEPLFVRELDVNSDALVIGSGVAGLTAAQTLASAGRRVFLVERTPAIGGRTARLGDVFPNLECASCMMEPLMDEVLHHENVELLTFAEVEEVLGYFGNFTVRVRKKARHVDPDGCYGCQSCQAVCPVDVPNEHEEGLAQRKAIFIPYAGALPNVSLIDEASCLYYRDQSCQACVASCPFGNIDLDARDEIVELDVGAVIVATGAELETNTEAGAPFSLPPVFSTMALERMLNASGCTNGDVKLRDGRVPTSVALIHCADPDGNGPVEPCSRTCCMAMSKYARLLREKLPDAKILRLAWEHCVGGKGFREFSHRASQEAKVDETNLKNGDRVRVLSRESNEETVRTYLVPGMVDPVATGAGVHLRVERPDKPAMETEVDMVVLAPPLRGDATLSSLAHKMRLEQDERGFLKEEHERLRSFSTRVEGVLVAGAAQGPKDIEEAASHGAAAAGVALAALVPGRKLQVDPARARVREEDCGGCQMCATVCPYRAVVFNAGTRRAEVNDLLCRGCGVCVATCPSAAIEGRHFTDEQILAEIEALLA